MVYGPRRRHRDLFEGEHVSQISADGQERVLVGHWGIRLGGVLRQSCFLRSCCGKWRSGKPLQSRRVLGSGLYGEPLGFSPQLLCFPVRLAGQFELIASFSAQTGRLRLRGSDQLVCPQREVAQRPEPGLGGFCSIGLGLDLGPQSVLETIQSPEHRVVAG
jgi:hypothetical protein